MSIAMLEGRIESMAWQLRGMTERCRELEARHEKMRGELEVIEQTLMAARHEKNGIARNLLIISAIGGIRKSLGRNRRHRK